MDYFQKDGEGLWGQHSGFEKLSLFGGLQQGGRKNKQGPMKNLLLSRWPKRKQQVAAKENVNFV